MSDEVGVDPGRLNELASRLEHLRDVLAANVPVIMNTLNEYWSAGQSAPVNLSVLQQAQGQSVQDASDLRARYDLALDWEERPAVHLHGGMISIPWLTAGSQLDTASAKADAILLADAQESGNEAVIKSVERDIADHQNDKQWLADFYYQSGVQFAKVLAKSPDIQRDFSLLAQVPTGNPYFMAGLLNTLNRSQLLDFMILSKGAPSSDDEAIATAMADGMLSPQAMAGLVGWLTSSTENSDGRGSTPGPLLQAIAKNPKASARLIAIMNPDSPQFKTIIKLYANYGAENTFLQIMANAIAEAPSQKQAMAMIKSMVTDLSVLDTPGIANSELFTSTISASQKGLQAFLEAATLRLMPAITPNDPNFPADWYLPYGHTLDQYLGPLVNEIGTAFSNQEDSVSFLRGYFEGIIMGAAFAAIPLDGVSEAGAIALGVAEPAGTPFLPTQQELNLAFTYIFPDKESGAQAERSFNQQLQSIVVVGGIVRIYTAAHDRAGAEALLSSPELGHIINMYLTHGSPSSYDQSWLNQPAVGNQTRQEVISQLVAASADLGNPS